MQTIGLSLPDWVIIAIYFAFILGIGLLPEPPSRSHDRRV